MKTLLNDIINRLSQAPCPQSPQSPLYHHVDIDYGQLDFFDGPPPVKFPAALIDIAAAEPSNLANRVQIDIVTLQVRIIDLILSPSNARATEEQKKAAFRSFDLITETNRLLHGWTGAEHYGPLTRAGFQKINRRDQLREYRLTYKVQLTNSSAEKQAVKIKQPIISLEL